MNEKKNDRVRLIGKEQSNDSEHKTSQAEEKKKSIQEKKSGKCFYRWPRKLLRRNLQLQHFDVVGAALPSCSCSCCCRLVEVCIVLCRIARYTKNDDEEPKSSNNRRLRGANTQIKVVALSVPASGAGKKKKRKRAQCCAPVEKSCKKCVEK